jgi:small neutral amino acid transporter SnatA (MarC family)
MSDLLTDKKIKIKWKVLFLFAVSLPLFTSVIVRNFVKNLSSSEKDTIYIVSAFISLAIVLILVLLFNKKKEKLQ